MHRSLVYERMEEPLRFQKKLLLPEQLPDDELILTF